MFIYTDAHCHLHQPALRAQLESILLGSPEFCIVSAAACEADWQDLETVHKEMRQRFPQSRFLICLGLHPQEAAGFCSDPIASDRALKKLEEALSSGGDGIAAVGEIGLDNSLIKKAAPEQRGLLAETQRRLLISQLELARRFRLPAVLHCVKAHGALQDALRGFPGLPASLLHGFYGSPDLLRSYLKYDLYISFSTALLLRDSASPDWLERKARWQALANMLPLERLLPESDSCLRPDGSVTPPRTTVQAAAVLAELYRCPAETVLEQARSNLRRWLF